MSNYAYDHLKTPKNTASGVGDVAYMAPVSAFTTIQCPTAPFTNPGDEVKISTAHTFPAQEGFIKCVLAPDKNKVTAGAVGDKGSKKMLEKAEIFLPGNYVELHEWLKNALNQPFIVLIPSGECSAGEYLQLGCDCKFAWIEAADYDTGTNAEGSAGYKIVFSVATEAILTYAATVTEKP